jgi:hypothetical protein
MLGLAAAHGLGLVQTARMLAMAYVVRADAMVACFDAKYHYWVWRPYQAIPLAATNANPATVAGPNWRPRTTPTSRVPVRPRLPQRRRGHGPACVLRHRQGPLIARQPRHRYSALVRQVPGRAQTSIWRVCWSASSSSAPMRNAPASGASRPLCRRPPVPAAR